VQCEPGHLASSDGRVPCRRLRQVPAPQPGQLFGRASGSLAWRTVVLNRWRKLCPSCFDIEAEKAGMRYTFTDVEAMSWSDRPAPRGRSKRGR